MLVAVVFSAKKSALKGSSILDFLGGEDAQKLDEAVDAITPEETIRCTGPLMFTAVCGLLKPEVLPKEVFHGVSNEAGEGEVEEWVLKGLGVGVHKWEGRWVGRC